MSISAQQVVNPTVVDPNSVDETFVNGPINLNIMGSTATLTFTSVRPDVKKMFNGNGQDLSAIVVLRLTMPTEHLLQLRQLLSQAMPALPELQGMVTTGSTLKQ
ncbi:hypothetical protein [Bradyrhizobium sp. AZCC 2230]|uniref:hypothetical protein n=1 Tax=Bradyrhizobium sp. AZCC 2230 TaxID=3117021 RepID=UPI002FF023AE